MIRVLSDFHHADLAESLQILFEDRYGCELWFPATMDWFSDGIWQFERAYHGDAVARQYLVGIWADALATAKPEHDAFLRDDPTHPGRQQRGITYAAARDQRWDIVIASLPDNYDGFYRLAQATGARFGIQIGNNVQPVDERADFILSSSTLPFFDRPPGVVFDGPWGKPTVIYHQEFSLDSFRHEWPPSERASVASFVQCFAENAVPYAEFLSLARQAPDLDWRVYGAYGSHPVDEFAAGNLTSTPMVADRMRDTRVIWHSKSWSDGYGHIVHNAFSVGRPVIGRASYYADKLAGPLWVEGVTSFDIDRHTAAETVDLLRRLRDDDDFHRTVSEAAAARFLATVDFDYEASAIGSMLGLGLGVQRQSAAA